MQALETNHKQMEPNKLESDVTARFQEGNGQGGDPSNIQAGKGVCGNESKTCRGIAACPEGAGTTLATR